MQEPRTLLHALSDLDDALSDGLAAVRVVLRRSGDTSERNEALQLLRDIRDALVARVEIDRDPTRISLQNFAVPEGTDPATAQVIRLLASIDDKLSYQIEPKGPAADVQIPALIRRVLVTTALASPATLDEVVRGPDVSVPRGFRTTIRQRRHSGSPTGYLAFEPEHILQTDRRVELGDGDSLDFWLENFEDCYFGADTDTISFEMITEIAPRTSVAKDGEY